MTLLRARNSVARPSAPELRHPVTVDLRQVILGLLHDPALLGAAEHLRQPHGHLRRNPAPAIHKLRQRVRVTPRAAAARVILKPSGSMHSCNATSPGCGRFFMVIGALRLVAVGWHGTGKVAICLRVLSRVACRRMSATCGPDGSHPFARPLRRYPPLPCDGTCRARRPSVVRGRTQIADRRSL